MAMKQKRSDTAAKVPLTTDLEAGELAVNTHDAILFMKKTVSGVDSVVRIGAEMSAALAAALKETSGAAFLAALGVTIGGGGFDLIESKAATGSEVTFTGLEDYRDLMLIGTGVQSGSSMTTQMQVGNSGGYLSSGQYNLSNGSTANQFTLSDSGVSARSFSMTVLNFNTTDAIKPCNMGAAANTYTNWPIAVVSAAALDRVRVFPSTGTFSAGTLYMLGRQG